MQAMAFSIRKLYLLLLLLISMIFSLPFRNPQAVRIPLTHRDSPTSPLYDPTSTAVDRLVSAAAFDRTSAINFNAIGGEFHLDFFMGTPAVHVVALIDVSGDLTWTECVPCPDCINSSITRYDPLKSSTMEKYTCASAACLNLAATSGCSKIDDELCTYRKEDESGRVTEGPLYSDTFSFPVDGNGGSNPNRSIVAKTVMFGCGKDGVLSTNLAVARVGLLGGPLALIWSIFPPVRKERRPPLTFSHCFVASVFENGSSVSHMAFGNDASLLGREIPMKECNHGRGLSYYSPALLDIAVGTSTNKLGIPKGAFDEQGKPAGCGVRLVTTTPITLMAGVAYDLMLQQIKEIATLPVAPRRSGELWDLCYVGTKDDLNSGNHLPGWWLFFENGAITVMHPHNLFVPVGGDRLCLAMWPTNGTTVFGTYAQQNINVGYDLDGMKFYMFPYACNIWDKLPPPKGRSLRD